MTDEPTAAPGTRSIRLEVHIDATVEEVWAAVATGPGITSWFVPTTVDERVGGAITQRFGPGMEIEGEVRAFEPGRRFVFGAAGGGPGLAFEFLVEAATGGGTIVRLINSGFLSDVEWDGEYDGMTEGWKAFLVVLKTYLERSAGLPAESVQTGGHAVDPVAAWRLLLGPEGLGAGDVADIEPAERLSLAPASAPPLAGVVEHFTGERDRPGSLAPPRG